MPTNPNVQMLRAKVIGALIREARLLAKRSLDECAQVLGTTAEIFESIELGGKDISLPELESLAYFLDVPLEHFWERESLAAIRPERTLSSLDQLMRIRHRMIGALLRQARQESGFTIETVAERAQVTPEQLEAFERGQEGVPLPLLEVLTGLLHRSIREFQDQHGPVGVWNAQQRAVKDFLTLPLDLQLFVSKPVNRPYLELAIRLNEMSVEKLRAVAEGLLEITY